MKKIIPLSIVGLSSLAILAIPSGLNSEVTKNNALNTVVKSNIQDQKGSSMSKFTKSTVLTNEIVRSLGWHTKETITLDDWKTMAPNVDVMDGSFAGAAIVSIEIPASVRVIDYHSFYMATSLASVTFEPGSKLNTIGDSSFWFSGNTKSIVFPRLLDRIQKNAFSHSKIKHISFEENSTFESIGQNAFGNSELESIYIPESTKSIGENAFQYTNKLTNISMPIRFKGDNVAKYGFNQTQWDAIKWDDASFSGTDLNQEEILKLGWDKKSVITLSDWKNMLPNVTTISNAFLNNKALISIEIPNKVELIGDNTFNGAINLNKVTFEPGSKLSAIGLNAFSNTTKLKDIILPYHLKTESPNFGFTQEQWSKISWSNAPVNPEPEQPEPEQPGPEQPDKITSLTKEVAYQIGWTNKEVITLEDWNKYIPNVVSIEDGIWQNNQIVKSIVIPSHIKILSDDLFENSSLESISFTEDSQLHAISTRVFQGSNIKKIEIPLSVEVIEENAFASTSMLNEIIIDDKFKENYSFIGISDSQLENIKWIKMNSSTSIIVASVISAVVLISILGVVVYVFKVKKNKNNDVTSEASV